MKIVPVLLLLALLGGCASVPITSATDPDYVSARYDSTIVHYRGYDMARTFELEREYCSNITQLGMECTPFHEVFTATRMHEQDAVLEVLAERGIDSLMVVSFVVDYPNEGRFSYPTFGVYSALGSGVENTHVPTNPESMDETVRITLLDVEDRHVAWVAQTESVAPGNGQTENAAHRFLAQRVYQELGRAGLVQEPVWPM